MFCEYADYADTMPEDEFRRQAIVAMARAGIPASALQFSVKHTRSGQTFWYCCAEWECNQGPPDHAAGPKAKGPPDHSDGPR